MDYSRIGYYFEFIDNLEQSANNVADNGFEFFIAPLIQKDNKQFHTYCDLQIRNEGFSNMFVPRLVYDDLDQDYLIQRKFIHEQIDYSCYLGLPSMIVNSPNARKTIANFASIINQKLSLNGGLESIVQIWFYYNLTNNQLNGEIKNETLDKWSQWNQLRNHLVKSRKIGVAIELESNENLPTDLEIDRWSGEPVKVLILNTNLFLINSKGYPVLSKTVQRFVSVLREKTAYELHLIVRGELSGNLELSHYFKYLEHLKTLEQDKKNTELHKYAAGYEDYLQVPLQPLMDNLESMSYEVFEKDPVKYKEYQRAIKEALLTFSSDKLVLMVVGAGRGPLVTAAIEAALESNKQLKLFAVEKNRNAMNTLNYLKNNRWNNYKHVEVEVICKDMREFNPITKADVIVSELLGSLGDNELSPECLDGLWKCCKKDTISIPQTYTSFIAPIMSYKLHTRTLFERDQSKPLHTAFENQYVVYLKNYFLIDKPKELFKFDHFDMTIHPTKKDNQRLKSLEFKTELPAVCHGFAGYFEATLFKDIKLSIVYGEETKDMFSWFPLYIPIYEAFELKPDTNLEVTFWRNVDKQKVWYEWTIISPVSSHIHNINGRSQKIGLIN